MPKPPKTGTRSHSYPLWKTPLESSPAESLIVFSMYLKVLNIRISECQLLGRVNYSPNNPLQKTLAFTSVFWDEIFKNKQVLYVCNQECGATLLCSFSKAGCAAQPPLRKGFLCKINPVLVSTEVLHNIIRGKLSIVWLQSVTFCRHLLYSGRIKNNVTFQNSNSLCWMVQWNQFKEAVWL